MTEEGLMSMLRRPASAMGSRKMQNDDSNAYDELTILQKLVDGKSIYKPYLLLFVLNF